MTPARQAEPELDSLIDDITVDCHDQYEQLTAFQTAFENDANLPCPATVIGEHVEVLSVSANDDRLELIATCQRGERRYDIALLDADLHADTDTTRLIAAYRRWRLDLELDRLSDIDAHCRGKSLNRRVAGAVDLPVAGRVPRAGCSHRRSR